MWGGSFSAVLPYVQAAFGQALTEFSAQLPEGISCDLNEVVTALCEPDPTKRGHPRNRQGHVNQFALDRYVSKFDILAYRAELKLITGTN
jgi:hypothetical protein